MNPSTIAYILLGFMTAVVVALIIFVVIYNKRQWHIPKNLINYVAGNKDTRQPAYPTMSIDGLILPQGEYVRARRQSLFGRIKRQLYCYLVCVRANLTLDLLYESKLSWTPVQDTINILLSLVTNSILCFNFKKYKIFNEEIINKSGVFLESKTFEIKNYYQKTIQALKSDLAEYHNDNNNGLLFQIHSAPSLYFQADYKKLRVVFFRQHYGQIEMFRNEYTNVSDALSLLRGYVITALYLAENNLGQRFVKIDKTYFTDRKFRVVNFDKEPAEALINFLKTEIKKIPFIPTLYPSGIYVKNRFVKIQFALNENCTEQDIYNTVQLILKIKNIYFKSLFTAITVIIFIRAFPLF